MIIYFAHMVNYIIYARVAKILFLVSIPLLFYTLFFGVKLNEGSRWIRLPIVNMNISDLRPGETCTDHVYQSAT